MGKLVKQLLAYIAAAAILSGCGQTAAPAQTPVTEAVPETVATTAPTESAPASMEQQGALLWDLREQWLQEDFSEYEPYYYTFADLDHNGRMEVFSAITQGTGVFTTGQMFEVNSGFDGLTQCEIPENLPEVIVSDAECYRDGDAYHYAFSDTTRNGAAESWQSFVWLTLEDGILKDTSLAWSHYLFDWETEKVTITYSNAAGEISEDDFLTAFETAGQGMERSMVSFDWLTANQIRSKADILDSYEHFTGEHIRLRPAKKNLEYWLEGEKEAEPASLFVGQNYSVYIPVDGWQYCGKMEDGCLVDSWSPDVSVRVEFAVIQLNGMSRNQAGQWILEHFSDYDLIYDKWGNVGGNDSHGNMLDSRLLPVRDGFCAVCMFCPMEAAEGYGVRLQVMADTFEML